MDNQFNDNKISQLISDSDFPFIKDYSNKSHSEKLQLLALKLIILLWEDNDSEEVESMEKKLELIDELRHELNFFRAEYYKRLFDKKNGLLF